MFHLLNVSCHLNYFNVNGDGVHDDLRFYDHDANGFKEHHEDVNALSLF